MAWKDEGVIEIHTDIPNPKDELETYIHECLHIINPEWSELKVTRAGKKITNVLWKQGYRKVKLKVK